MSNLGLIKLLLSYHFSKRASNNQLCYVDILYCRIPIALLVYQTFYAEKI